MKAFILLAIVALTISAIQAQGIGDRLTRTYNVFSSLPVTSSSVQQAGWFNYTHCDPNLGIAYTEVKGGPTQSSPVSLFYTAGGQIAGLGVTHFGPPVATLSKYWLPIPGNTNNYFMSASFRNSKTFNLCDPNARDENILGTQVVINQGSLNRPIPLREADAAAQGYTAGSCLNTMGVHWSYDLATAPVMSWKSGNLQPVVPMYKNGTLVAFFFTTSNTQTMEPFGEWEVTLPQYLMCFNWCNSSCSWDVSWFSTFHFYLNDYLHNTCESRC